MAQAGDHGLLARRGAGVSRFGATRQGVAPGRHPGAHQAAPRACPGDPRLNAGALGGWGRCRHRPAASTRTREARLRLPRHTATTRCSPGRSDRAPCPFELQRPVDLSRTSSTPPPAAVARGYPAVCLPVARRPASAHRRAALSPLDPPRPPAPGTCGPSRAGASAAPSRRSARAARGRRGHRGRRARLGGDRAGAKRSSITCEQWGPGRKAGGGADGDRHEPRGRVLRSAGNALAATRALAAARRRAATGAAASKPETPAIGRPAGSPSQTSTVTRFVEDGSPRVAPAGGGPGLEGEAAPDVGEVGAERVAARTRVSEKEIRHDRGGLGGEDAGAGHGCRRGSVGFEGARVPPRARAR